MEEKPALESWIADVLAIWTSLDIILVLCFLGGSNDFGALLWPEDES
jgi:hypothetical protein